MTRRVQLRRRFTPSRRGKGRGHLSPIGDTPQDFHPGNHLVMSPRCLPAIPLATTDLSCGSNVKDLTCRRYAGDEMTTECHRVACLDHVGSA